MKKTVIIFFSLIAFVGAIISGCFQSLHPSYNLIDIDLTELSWNAYDDHKLIRGGKISGGKAYCKDIHKNCETVRGVFTIYRVGGEKCKSSTFPLGKGGAPMPYCMFFHEGYAIHGSNNVPEHNASHGCVRMSPEDAEWLNKKFVQVGRTKVYTHY